MKIHHCLAFLEAARQAGLTVTHTDKIPPNFCFEFPGRLYLFARPDRVAILDLIALAEEHEDKAGQALFNWVTTRSSLARGRITHWIDPSVTQADDPFGLDHGGERVSLEDWLREQEEARQQAPAPSVNPA